MFFVGCLHKWTNNIDSIGNIWSSVRQVNQLSLGIATSLVIHHLEMHFSHQVDEEAGLY